MHSNKSHAKCGRMQGSKDVSRECLTPKTPPTYFHPGAFLSLTKMFICVTVSRINARLHMETDTDTQMLGQKLELQQK